MTKAQMRDAINRLYAILSRLATENMLLRMRIEQLQKLSCESRGG